jgi:hypothetical protein
MSSIMEVLRNRQPYGFFIMGLIWLAMAVYVSSAFLLWPVVALLAGGLLLRYRPAERVTWAWTTASLGLGIMLVLYQMASDIALLGGAFSTIAAESLVVFVILGALHVVMAYTSTTTPGAKQPEG